MDRRQGCRGRQSTRDRVSPDRQQQGFESQSPGAGGPTLGLDEAGVWDGGSEADELAQPTRRTVNSNHRARRLDDRGAIAAMAG